MSEQTKRQRASIHFMSEFVYCSSTMHYEIRLTLLRGKRRLSANYDFNGGLMYVRSRHPSPCPKYLECAILDRVRELYRAGKLRFYEYDRDQNKRFDELRYHHAPSFEHLIDLKKDEPNGERSRV